MLKFNYINSLVFIFGFGVLSFSTHADESRNVKIVLQSPLSSVDSCQLQTGSTSRVVKLNVYEALTSINTVDGGVNPRLATNWQRVTPNTWRFKLRENVYFHDGTPFNAKSVVYSLNRALDPKLSCDPYQRYFSNTKVGTKILDDHTVEISTIPEQPILPTFLESVAIVSTNTPKDMVTRTPIGTGPYKLVRWDTQRDLVLERNDTYWGKKAQAQQATYVWREDSFVRATMAKLNEVDLAFSIADQHADNPETDVSFINNDMTRIHIHTDKAPLNDVRIRKALNFALDRKSLIGVLVNKKAKPATQIVGPAVFGYNPGIKPYSYDINLAKKLVTQAKEDGVDTSKTIVLEAAANDFPNADEVREALVAMWAEAGLNVKVKVLELSQFRKALRPPFSDSRSPTISMTSHDNMTGDAGFSILSKYHSSSWQADVPSKEMDAKINEALLATGEVRRKKFQDIVSVIHEEVVPEVWLYEMASNIRINPRVIYKPNSSSNVVVELSDISFKE